MVTLKVSWEDPEFMQMTETTTWTWSPFLCTHSICILLLYSLSTAIGFMPTLYKWRLTNAGWACLSHMCKDLKLGRLPDNSERTSQIQRIVHGQVEKYLCTELQQVILFNFWCNSKHLIKDSNLSTFFSRIFTCFTNLESAYFHL